MTRPAPAFTGKSMANVPTPRSYNQVLQDIIDGFTSRQGIDKLRIGSPILSILEASAQSDLRSSQDIFAMLNSRSLDRAEGDSLDRIGAEEDTPRRSETFASGKVNVGDSSFAKISTKIYVGLPAPIVGSGTLYVADAQSFNASGNIYIGRGTPNFEGPLEYTAVTNLGTYWSITLAGGNETQKFHNLNEQVVMAQGGDRLVSSGTIGQTPQGNVAEGIQFSTLYSVTVPDGEVLVTGVPVVAKRPGTDGNVPAGAINSFPSEPFAGATITNPLPFNNALPAEDDSGYRERIRRVRQSRSKGTPLSIESGVLGTIALDENKAVLSAKVVRRQNFPTILYIDDGTGYEEKTQGVAIESVIASATGGEQYFETNNRPIAKAFVETTATEPFALVAGSKLAVSVDGVTYEHTFSSEEFRNIGNASAFEVVASINGDEGLPFDARLSGNGSKVSIIADADTQESLAVEAVQEGETDANLVLGFTAGRVDTMLLYKNDRLLTKDGRLALLTSSSQGLWAPNLTNPSTLTLNIDGTGAVTYSFTDADFVAQNTGYATLSSSNSLASWVKVLNSKLPGVSAEKSGSAIVLISNLGPDSRARLTVSGGSMVNDGMFSLNDSLGASLDYTLDRNTGQLRLEESLQVDDTLAIGTAATRAFVESDSISTTALVSTAKQWWVVDGRATLVSTALIAGSVVTIADYNPTPANTWGDRVRTTAATGTPFTDVVAGDWAIFYDSIFSTDNRGAWRVAYVDPAGTYFDIERPTAGWTPQASVVLATGGLKFARTDARIQEVSIPGPATGYTAASFVDAINADLRGATAEVYRTNKIRVRTNSFNTDSDIALVAQNAEAEKLLMSTGDYIINLTSHLAVAMAQKPEFGSHEFVIGSVSSVTSSTQVVRTGTDAGLTGGHQILFLRPTPDQDTGSNKGREANVGYHSPIEHLSGTTIVVRTPALQEFLPTERFLAAAGYAIGPEDEFAVLVDEDEQTQRYIMPMWRAVKPTTGTYGATNLFTDSDNANNSLALAFGLTYDFLDFAAWMRARAKTHNESGDTNKTILYRYTRFGPEGELANLRYVYPTAASSSVAVSTDPNSDGFTRISVALPSNAARTGYTVRNTTKIGLKATTFGSLQKLWYILGFGVTTADRVIKLNYKTQTSNFTVGQVLTGGTSTATGTISADVDGGTTGTLTLTGVVGNFIDGEIITDALTGSATASGTQYGFTTLTLDLAGVTGAGLTGHGFNPGVALWIQSADGNFPTGLKTITAAGAATVSYRDTVATAVASGPPASPITISVDTGEATLVGSTVVDGDLANIDLANPGMTAGYTDYKRSVRILAHGDQWWMGAAATAAAVAAAPAWKSLTQSQYLSFFPINTSAAAITAIAASVNALAAVANSSCPVTAVAVGDGLGDTSGVVTQASFEEFSSPSKSYSFYDGLNWVRSQVAPVLPANNYEFTFKTSVESTLATNSDWANEEVRLAPVTAKNVVDWFNTQGVSGLSSAAENSGASGGDKPQVSTLLPGSTGGIRVQGGTANSVSAPIIGSASSISGTYSLVTVKKADAIGLRCRHWVEVVNTNPLPKNLFAAGTIVSSLSSSGSTGTLILDAGSSTKIWNWANTAAAVLTGTTWQVEKQGRYVALVWDAISTDPQASMTGVQEGDWVSISGGTMNSRNLGNFRVVRIDDSQRALWIENENVLEEVATVDLRFRTFDSAMPGDKLIINTTLLGTNNLGTFTVTSLDNADRFKLYVNTGDNPWTTFTGPVTLGTAAPLVQMQEGSASKLIKKIRTISPNSDDGTLVDIKFKTVAGYRLMSAAAGSLIQPIDKLDFPTDLFLGVDGYRYSTGLIHEVNRVAYGDPADPAAYPGIIAAGANVNIQGPLVRRITCSLALRLKSGVSSKDIIARVRSAVASVINALGVGDPVAISDLVTAAGSVAGVVAVTVLAPIFSAGNDLISIQPFEKPLVLDLEQDIAVSLVGD